MTLSATAPKEGELPARGPEGELAAASRGQDLASSGLLLGGLGALGLALRSIGIGSTNLWLDEANSWFVATHPLDTIVGRTHQIPGAAAHLPLYFVLLKLWMALFGDSESALRSLSVLFGLALLPVTYIVGTYLLTRRAALLGTLLVAVSSLHVYFAQEARMYMLLALLTTCCAWAYLAWREERARGGRGLRPLAAYVASAILALHTHYGAALLLVALGLDALIGALRIHGPRIHRDEGLRLWASAQLPVALALIPFLLTVNRAEAAASQAWRTPLGPEGALREFFLFFLSFVHGPYYFAADLMRGAADYWREPFEGAAAARFAEQVVVFPLTLLAVVAALSYPPRKPDGRRAASSPTWFLYLCLLVPLAVGVASSIHQGLDFKRYFLFTTPYLALLLGEGLVRMPAAARVWVLATLLSSAALGLARYWRTTDRDSDYRPVARLLERSVRPADAIVAVPPDNAFSLRYYLRSTGLVFSTLPSDSLLAGELPARNGRSIWVVIDYRSPLFGASPSRMARTLGEPSLQRRFGAGAGGVLIVVLDPEKRARMAPEAIERPRASASPGLAGQKR